MLYYGRFLALSTNIRLHGSGKHASLLRFGNNYGRKKFYVQGQRRQS